MLEKFRELSKTWVAKLLLVLITVPFALFGIQYYFHQSGAGDGVARVNGVSLSRAAFSDSVRNQLERVRSGAPVGSALDEAALNTPELRYAALQGLVHRELLLQQAQHSQLTIPDSVLIRTISALAPFQDQGHFSESLYQRVLGAQGMSPVQFEQRMREDLLIQLQQDSLSGTQWAPSVAVNAFLTASEQTRTISAATWEPDLESSEKQLSPEQISTYYTGHPEQFKTPELVNIQYLLYSAADLAPKIEVTPQELQQAYNDPARKPHWQSPETRHARHILIALPDKPSPAQRQHALEQAQQLLAKLKSNPSQFAAIAKTNSQDAGSAAQGGDLGYFPAGTMTPAFDSAVLAMKPGEISAPVLTPFGYHLIQLLEIRPGQQKSLGEVTPELTRELRQQAARQQFATGAENFSNLVYERSNSLEPAAQQLRLNLQHLSEVQRNGIVGPGEPNWLSNPKFLAAIFSPEVLEQGRNTPAIEVAPDTLVAARVSAHTPASLRPLAQVVPQIRSELARQQAIQQARSTGEAALAALKAGHSPAISWQPSQSLTQAQAAAGALPPTLIKAVFTASRQGLPQFVGASTASGAYMVVRISSVTNPDLAAIESKRRAQIQVGLDQAYAEAVFGQYLEGLRQSADVRLIDHSILENHK